MVRFDFFFLILTRSGFSKPHVMYSWNSDARILSLFFIFVASANCGEFAYFYNFNPRTYTKSHTPTMVQGRGLMKPLPRVVDMLQYFETILRSVESFWPSLHDEVYFKGGSTADDNF